jgi:uncharacterized integral membrane protein
VIRAFLLVALLAALFVFYRANGATFVQVAFMGRQSPPLPLFWLLIYAFLMGALAYALFTLPERFATWRELRRHKRSLKKMGKNLGAVIHRAQESGD